MWQALQAFRTRFAIPMREIHTDSGSEFMTTAFVSHLGSEVVSARVIRGLFQIVRTQGDATTPLERLL